jgi:PAS domain S-box-containing protein
MSPLSNDEDTKISVIITDRKEDEERFRMQARMLNAVGDAIIVTDTDRKIIYWNDAATKIYGWKPEDILGYNIAEVTLPEIPKKNAGEIAARDPMVETRHGMFEARHRDGHLFPVHVNDSPLFDDDHNLIAIISASHDISDQKRVDEKLIASLQEKDVMLREIHHRVKNNLQLMSGLLDMNRLRTADESTLSMLTDMMLKIQTMAQIHERLYESKHLGKIDLTGQIRDQVTALSEIFSHTGHMIRCEINPAEIFLPVDQALPCALAVNEILSNAYKHAFKGRERGTVEITAVQENDRIRIMVRDDGIGLPPHFDISKSDSLGFSLIMTLVQHQLHGSLTYQSRNGTKICFEFPVEQ